MLLTSIIAEALSDIRFRLRALLSRKAVQDELDCELWDHFEHHIAKLIAAGVQPLEAERRARIAFGGFDQIREECREVREVGLIESLIRDARYGLRMIARSPGFSLVVVLTLALGIGASTAVFSVVDAILIKPLPYPHAERIVLPWRQAPPGLNLGYSEFPWGRFEFQVLARTTQTLQWTGAFQADSFNLTGIGDPVRLDGIRSSAGFFPSLGVTPALGRTFTLDEDQPGHGREVVLGYRLWRDKFSQDPGVLGRTIALNRDAYTVIGVMPAGFDFPRGSDMPGGFTFPTEPELWVPLALSNGPIIPAEPSELAVIGRARQGVSEQQVQNEMNVLAKRLEEQIPQGKGWYNSRVTALSQQITGGTRRPLLLILCAMAVVLLITCFNVANLLIARGLSRRREFTLRAALGAGRGRLLRQLLTESLILASLGGIAGLLVAVGGMSLVRAYGPQEIPRIRDVALDARVLAFALIATLLTGLVFGILPALGASRSDLAGSLKEGGQRAGASVAAARLRGRLLVSQVALALVLVVAAGLLTRSFFRLLATDPGFNPDQVLTFQLSLPGSKYTTDLQVVSLYQSALARVRSAAGVASAGIVEIAPMSGATESTGLRIADRPAEAAKETPISNYTIASPGYFSTVGTPVLRGRDFVDGDTADSMPVSI
ncbi:MAG TPA: ABC transporter permease, partial [Blastocatellia bacterium]|nr:ABC transporter permease [Blastocatellia bacterium]